MSMSGGGGVELRRVVGGAIYYVAEVAFCHCERDSCDVVMIERFRARACTLAK
jgi:hypothetical protein